MSHYSEEARFQIKKRMCDDWRSSDLKLPTYMMLVARFIEKTGIPEAWLKKLSHQTMAKMIAGTSTPRHEFWACLHLYLLKKYGPLSIEPSITSADVLGQSLTHFAKAESIEPLIGSHSVGEHTKLHLTEAQDHHYAYAVSETTKPAASDFHVAMVTRLEGVAVQSDQKDTLMILKDAENSSLQYQTVKLSDA